MTASALAPPLTPPRSVRTAMVSAARFALPSLLLIFLITFSILVPETFATIDNFRTVLSTQSVLAMLALGALVTLVIGEFDLSLGAQAGLAALLIPGFSANGDLPIFVSVILAVAITTAIGFANGLLVAKAHVNSFIATIGTAALVGAVVLAYSGGTVIFEGVPPELLDIASGAPLGIPAPIIYVAVAAFGVWILLRRTPFGRYMSATGGSRDAARLSGINTDWVVIATFALAGTFCGLAGTILAGQLGSGNPAVGPAYLLPAFAAAFLGATSFHVGQFNVWGTITAVITIAFGVAGLNLLGMPPWVEPAFNGVALLAAVALTRYLRGKPL